MVAYLEHIIVVAFFNFSLVNYPREVQISRQAHLNVFRQLIDAKRVSIYDHIVT